MVAFEGHGLDSHALITPFSVFLNVSFVLKGFEHDPILFACVLGHDHEGRQHICTLKYLRVTAGS